MKGAKSIFVDRDGVLNRKPVTSRYVRNWSEFQWMPGAIEAVALLKKAGYQVILITNQAGIGLGQMTEQDLFKIFDLMQLDLGKQGGQLDGMYFCPHRPDAGCNCRKPKPGLLLKAKEELGLDLAKTTFIGDEDKDLLAGQQAGCPTLLVSPGCSLLDLVRTRILVGV